MATDDGMAPSDEWEDYYNTYEDEKNEMNKNNQRQQKKVVTRKNAELLNQTVVR